MTSEDPRPNKDQIMDKWMRYIENRDATIRDSLIAHYMPLVRTTARRMHSRLRGHVEIEDIVSSGTLGMLNAIDAFDPRRGISFETFCAFRIRGAMLDEVRSMDWVPRRIRTVERELNDAKKSLANTLGYKPTELELAGHLSIPPERIEKMERESRPPRIRSLVLATSTNGEDAERIADIDALTKKIEQEFDGRMFRQELRERLLGHLSKSEYLIVVLYYFEAMKFREIAQTLDVSECRICQIHSGVLMRLRTLAGVRPADYKATKQKKSPVISPITAERSPWLARVLAA